MFWNVLYRLCEANSTKPYVVAKEIGASNSVCTKWKNGSIPNGETLLKLANYFNVSVDYLLCGEEKSITDKPQTDNSTANEKHYDETTLQVATAFQKLDFISKAKVMSLIAELTEKTG